MINAIYFKTKEDIIPAFSIGKIYLNQCIIHWVHNVLKCKVEFRVVSNDGYQTVFSKTDIKYILRIKRQNMKQSKIVK